MWTRVYLFLLALRLYFALSPSYIHPDENFQGPEVVAGRTFDFPHELSWEFTSDHPVRSVYSLWPVYGMPMKVMQWIWAEIGEQGDISPEVVYYVLRGLMFIWSFVLEDWALHELVHSPRHRRLVVVLVASSYVTWTYQTHTFSNSVETLVVLWTLVMIHRLREAKKDSLLSPAILGALVTFGIFNRITFPAFVVCPSLFLIPVFFQRKLSLLVCLSTILITTTIAIAQDTYFYRPQTSFREIFTAPVITPFNSLLYNSNTTNLATHGLHPWYQHLSANLPLLLGPSLLFVRSLAKDPTSLTALSAISGTLILSIIPHQEARFLLPTVPLILSSIRLPQSRLYARYWLGIWIAFNLTLGILMGIFHQGGVVPVQIWLSRNYQTPSLPDAGAPYPNSVAATPNQTIETQVFWYRTYPPPIWLTDHAPLITTNLMGIPLADLQTRIYAALTASSSLNSCDPTKQVALVAPLSSLDLETWRSNATPTPPDFPLKWKQLWQYSRHLNLDDLDFGMQERGVLGEVGRVLGKRGLGAWAVGRDCSGEPGGQGRTEGGLAGDW